MINQALAELGWGFRGCTEPTCGAQASCAQQEVRNCFQISEALPHPKQARPGSQHEPGALVPERGHIRFHQGRAEIRGKGGALKVRDTHPSPRGACESDHTIEGKGGCWWPQGPPPRPSFFLALSFGDHGESGSLVLPAVRVQLDAGGVGTKQQREADLGQRSGIF